MSVSRTRPVMKVTRILDVRNRNLTAAALSLPRTITSHSSSSSFRQSTCIPFHPKLTVALSYNGAPTLLRDVASPYGNSRSRTFSSCKTLPTVKKISLLYPSVEVSIQRRFKKKSATKPVEVVIRLAVMFLQLVQYNEYINLIMISNLVVLRYMNMCIVTGS